MVLCRLMVVLSVMTALQAAEPPAGEVFSAKVELKTPKKAKDKRAGEEGVAPFSIFVPDEVKVVRGVVFNPFYEKTVEQQHWRTAAAHWDFAVMGANLFGVKKSDFKEVVLDGLKAMAAASGHPEIANAPMCLVGMSAGGGMAVSIAEAMPERVIAVAAVCLEVGPTSEATRKIPMITIFGEKDGKQMEKLSAKLPEQRALGAQWAIAVQWGRKHEFGKANNLIMPFFDAVIGRRYPEGASPEAGEVTLQPLTEELVRGFPFQAWLGDKDHWAARYAGVGTGWGKRSEGSPPSDPTRGCWLPDKRTARVWQSFVVPAPLIKIADPPGLGDGQSFVLHDAATKVEVRVVVAGDLELRNVYLYDGAERLEKAGGDARSFLIPSLGRGIHSLIAVGWGHDGRRHYSRPHTILVR